MKDQIVFSIVICEQAFRIAEIAVARRESRYLALFPGQPADETGSQKAGAAGGDDGLDGEASFRGVGLVSGMATTKSNMASVATAPNMAKLAANPARSASMPPTKLLSADPRRPNHWCRPFCATKPKRPAAASRAPPVTWPTILQKVFALNKALSLGLGDIPEVAEAGLGRTRTIFIMPKSSWPRMWQ